MTENLSVFFTGLDAVQVTFDTSPARVVTGYFDNAFVDANLGETIMDTTQPRIACRAVDVAGIPRGTMATIGDQSFSVVQIQPEGTGLATVTFAHED